MVAAANSRIMTMLPTAPRPVGGIPLIPISPPSQACLRTKPTNRKLTPMVVTARKSERTRSEAKPTTMPSRQPVERRRGQRQRHAGGRDHGERRGIGAGAEEGAMAEADLAAEAADHVQADRQDDVDADDRDDADLVGAHAVRAPAKPCGRIISSSDQDEERDGVAVEPGADEDGAVGLRPGPAPGSPSACRARCRARRAR